MRIAAQVARDKELHPERFCPVARCLWRTGDGSRCPRHQPREVIEVQLERDDDWATPAQQECKRCHGEGYIGVAGFFRLWRDHQYDTEERCPDCSGTGTAYEDTQAGKQLSDDDEIIDPDDLDDGREGEYDTSKIYEFDGPEDNWGGW